MSCDLTLPWGTVPRPPRRDPRGGDFINGPTPRETDVITIPTRYALHSYAKLGAARSWVFTTVRQLTPWDAYFGFNSTYLAGQYGSFSGQSGPDIGRTDSGRLDRQRIEPVIVVGRRDSGADDGLHCRPPPQSEWTTDSRSCTAGTGGSRAI